MLDYIKKKEEVKSGCVKNLATDGTTTEGKNSVIKVLGGGCAKCHELSDHA